MEQQAIGKVIAVKQQWWLKINTKPIRKGTMDGATFPHIIKVRYTVNGREYTKRKWISAGAPTPKVGDSLTVVYSIKKPARAKILPPLHQSPLGKAEGKTQVLL